MPNFGDYTMRAQPRRRVSDEKEEPVFLRKTFEMICSCDADRAANLACWSPGGETFIIKDCDAFAQDVIPRFFKHNKFSSFVRQLNFYGFRKVKAHVSAVDDADAKWWEFKHDLFHRDKSHLIAKMKRATHYGAPADTKEVEDLRSEVSRLRNHIDNMGDKIGHLTSLVEALAVEGAVRPAAAAAGANLSAACAADPSLGVRSKSLFAERGWEMRDAVDSLGDVGVGIGRLSFDCGDGQDEEDSKLFPPAVPSGAGCYDAAAFLPLHVMSRKRKLLGGSADDGGGGGGISDGVGVGGVKDAPWTAGDADTGVVVKQEMIVEPLEERVSEGIAVKQEIVDGSSARENDDPWPPFADSYASPLAIPAGTGAAKYVVSASSPLESSRKPAFCSTASQSPAHDSNGSGSNGDFLEGFTEQFLSFESPSSSFVLPDRGVSVASEEPSAAVVVAEASRPKAPLVGTASGCGKGEDGLGALGGSQTDEEEEQIDIEGGGEMSASAMSSSSEPEGMGPHGCSIPSTRQASSMEQVARKPGAASTSPPGIEELQSNLESLPLHNRAKLKEGLSALMQNPSFLATLVSQGQGTTNSVATGASRKGPSLPKVADVVDVSASASTAVAPSEHLMTDDGGSRPRATRSPTASRKEGSESVAVSSVNSGGSSGGGGGSCCPDRSQNRGKFGERRLPRSEEACA